MNYSSEQIQQLNRECENAKESLQRLCFDVVQAVSDIENEMVRDHLVHGAGRRLKTMSRCLSNVFELFPLEAKRPIDTDSLADAQINLQAFVMNLFGYFDNLAWAFVYRHNLLTEIGRKNSVGLFLLATQKRLPSELRQYLQSHEISTWHATYLKNYRDALAHRIPPYIPPALLLHKDTPRYTELELEKESAIHSQNWIKLREIEANQAEMESAFPVFMHSFKEDQEQGPVRLHPQMLADANTVIDFTPRFLKQWDQHA